MWCGSGSTLSSRDRPTGGNNFSGLFFLLSSSKIWRALQIEMTLFPQSHVKRAACHTGLQIKTTAHLLWIEFCHVLGNGSCLQGQVSPSGVS